MVEGFLEHCHAVMITVTTPKSSNRINDIISLKSHGCKELNGPMRPIMGRPR